MVVDLVDVKLAAELERVRAHGPRETIAHVVGVVYLGQVGDRYTHHERRKCDVCDAFKLRRLDEDARCPRTCCEALERKAHAQASVRLTDDVSVTKIAGMKFIDGMGANHFCVAQREE